MLIHICDGCHEKIEAVRFIVSKLGVVVDGPIKYEMNEREFCSLHCLQQYIINGMKGKGLDDHIMV